MYILHISFYIKRIPINKGNVAFCLSHFAALKTVCYTQWVQTAAHGSNRHPPLEITNYTSASIPLSTVSINSSLEIRSNPQMVSTNSSDGCLFPCSMEPSIYADMCTLFANSAWV